MAITQTFNETYEELFTRPVRRYNHLLGGRGRGGSYTGTDYYLFLITQPHYFRGYIMRNIFGDIRESLYRDLKDRIEDNETIDAADFHFNDSAMTCVYLPNGNTIISKGFKKSDSKRTAKLKSIAGATHVMIEEADEIEEEDFMQLDDSLRTIKSPIQIILIYNPPHKSHWIWRRWFTLETVSEIIPDEDNKPLQIYQPVPIISDSCLAIFSTYLDNIQNIDSTTVTNFESYKILKPEYYANVIRGYVLEGVRGRIYRNWKEITDKEFDDFDGVISYGGDFGFNDPFVLIKIKTKGNIVYLRELIHERGMVNSAIIEKFASLGIKKFEQVWMDSEDPKSITELQLAGYNIKPASKPPGSKLFGIKTLKEKKIYYTSRSINLKLAYESYAWLLNQHKEATDEPAHKFSHIPDAIRYGVLGGMYPQGLVIHTGKKVVTNGRTIDSM